MTIRLIFALWSVAALSLLAGCATHASVGGSVSTGPPVHEPSYDRGGGPPPWAPAHGYRRKKAYRYYHNHEVYYDTASAEFYWHEGGGWHVGVRLPGHIHIELSRGYNVVEYGGDEPWMVHGGAKSSGKGNGNKAKSSSNAKSSNKGKGSNKGNPGRGRGRGPK